MLLSSSPPVLKTGSHQLGLRPPKDLVLLGDLACCPAANFRRHKVLDCKHRQKSSKKPIAIFNLNISLRTLLTFSHCSWKKSSLNSKISHSFKRFWIGRWYRSRSMQYEGSTGQPNFPQTPWFIHLVVCWIILPRLNSIHRINFRLGIQGGKSQAFDDMMWWPDPPLRFFSLLVIFMFTRFVS